MLRQKLWRKLKHNFVFSNFFPPEKHAVYEIVLKNMVQQDRLQMTVVYCIELLSNHKNKSVFQMHILCKNIRTFNICSQQYLHFNFHTGT